MLDLKQSYKLITWDISSKLVNITYFGKVDDSGRGLKVKLVQNSLAITPTTETMRIYLKKPDNTKVYIDATIVNDYFQIILTNQVYAVPGNVQAELQLSVNGQWISSETFYITVSNNLVDSSILSSDDFKALQNALTDVDSVKSQLASISNEKASKTELQQVSLSYKESYATLALLQAAYPSGDIYNHTVLSDGIIYTYKNGWISTGIQANGTGVAYNSISVQMADDSLKNYAYAINLESEKIGELELTSANFGTNHLESSRFYVKELQAKHAGFVKLHIYSQNVSTIKVALLKKIGSSYLVENIVTFNVTIGENVIFTNLNITDVLNERIAVSGMSIGYKVASTTVRWDELIPSPPNIGDTLTSNLGGTSYILGYYFEVYSPDIQIPISKLDANIQKTTDMYDLMNDVLFAKQEIESVIFGNDFSQTLASTSHMYIKNIPIPYKGLISVDIYASATGIVTVYKVKKLSSSTFSIIETKQINVGLGLNSDCVSFRCDGEGSEYIGIAGTLKYKPSSNCVGFYEVNTDGNVVYTGSANYAILPYNFKVYSNQIGGSLFGKIVNMIGDSTTWGDIVGDGTKGIPWTTYIPELTGISTCRNYGLCGTALSGTNVNAFVNRYTAMDNNADYIGVFGGVNDHIQSKVLGTFGDTDNTTFYGSLDVLIKGLAAKYPTGKIFFITPMKTTKYFDTYAQNNAGFTLVNYKDAIIKVCDKYSIPVLDMFTYGNISPYLPAHITNLMPDGLHPNNAGYKRMASQIAEFIKRL